MDKEYCMQLICYLYDTYCNFIYDDKREYLSADYCDDFDEVLVKNELEDFFITMSFDCYEVWSKCDFPMQDLLHRSMEGFRRISDILIDSQNKRISFKYKFLSTIDELCQANEHLETQGENGFIDKFPSLNEKSLNCEIDYIRLILYHLHQMYPINFDDLPLEVRS